MPLLLKIRLKSSEGGSFQVFYFGSGQNSSEKHSVRFAVRRGDWQEQSVALPPLSPRFRLRLDPPGERGVCLIESIRFTPQLTIAAPAWPKPTVPEPVPGTLTIQSGALVLSQHPHEWGGFRVAVAGRQVATGHNRPLIGYLDPAKAKSAASPSVRWLDLARVATVTTGLDPATQALFIEAQLRDPDGGQWRLRQVFRPGSPAAIDVHTECSVDAPRDVVFQRPDIGLEIQGFFCLSSCPALTIDGSHQDMEVVRMPYKWPGDTDFALRELDVLDRDCPACGRMMHICDHRYRRLHTLEGPAAVGLQA